MKKLRYLVLLILFIPVIALAEPIHLTQEVIEEAFANKDVEISDYKIKFIFDNYSTGFVLTGDEYTLDEDIDLHQGFITPSTSQLVVVNLNGHNINQSLDVYSGKNATCVIRDLWSTNNNVVNMTINGPGTLASSIPNVNTSNVNIHGGTVTFNNVDVKGSVRFSSNYAPGVLNFNNSSLEGRFELWDSTIKIEGSRFNYSDNSIYNSLSGSIATINNSRIEVNYNSNNGIEITSNNGVPSKATITNSTIIGGLDALYVSTQCELTVDNSEIVGGTNDSWYGIYAFSGAKVQLSDVHIYFKRDVENLNAISITKTPNSNAEEQLTTYLKEGYIYWKNPDYQNYHSTFDDSDTASLLNRDIWIIKQQQDYTLDDEPTYIIPKENEVTVSVLGYKDLLEGVEVDDDELDDTEYTSEQNDENVDVTINNNYLQSLDIGKHLLKVSFVNGEASTTITITDQDPDAIVIPIEDEPVEEVKGEEEVKEDKKEERTNPKTGLPNHMVLIIPIVLLGLVYLYVSKKTLFKSRY